MVFLLHVGCCMMTMIVWHSGMVWCDGGVALNGALVFFVCVFYFYFNSIPTKHNKESHKKRVNTVKFAACAVAERRVNNNNE